MGVLSDPAVEACESEPGTVTRITMSTRVRTARGLDHPRLPPDHEPADPGLRPRGIGSSGLVVVLLLAAVAMLPLKLVTVKMLPFDNKSEFQVIVDMPVGTTLEQTAAATNAMADYLRTMPEVTDVESYVGTASPYNFNGLVRHYFLRQGCNVADIQVNLVGKDERSRQSHAIAKSVRGKIHEIGRRYGANAKVAEVPPGPPVLQTLVAEVYGPDDKTRWQVARQIQECFRAHRGRDRRGLVRGGQPGQV